MWCLVYVQYNPSCLHTAGLKGLACHRLFLFNNPQYTHLHLMCYHGQIGGKCVCNGRRRRGGRGLGEGEGIRRGGGIRRGRGEDRGFS